MLKLIFLFMIIFSQTVNAEKYELSHEKINLTLSSQYTAKLTLKQLNLLEELLQFEIDKRQDELNNYSPSWYKAIDRLNTVLNSREAIIYQLKYSKSQMDSFFYMFQEAYSVQNYFVAGQIQQRSQGLLHYIIQLQAQVANGDRYLKKIKREAKRGQKKIMQLKRDAKRIKSSKRYYRRARKIIQYYIDNNQSIQERDENIGITHNQNYKSDEEARESNKESVATSFEERYRQQEKELNSIKKDMDKFNDW